MHDIRQVVLKYFGFFFTLWYSLSDEQGMRWLPRVQFLFSFALQLRILSYCIVLVSFFLRSIFLAIVSIAQSSSVDRELACKRMLSQVELEAIPNVKE